MTTSESPQSPVEPTSAPNAVQPADDWAGLTDPAERRRRQNRINQRARRRRQRAQSNQELHPKSVVPSPPSTIVTTSSSNSPTSPPKINACLSPSFLRSLLEKFAQTAYHSYVIGDPTSDHLLTLTKANVFRAFGQNLKLVGGSLDNLDDDALSRFSLPAPVPANTNTSSTTPSDFSNLPLSLQPTKIQRTIPHHPWLDFFPLPKMRDNLILAGDDWDDDQLCHDIMGFWDSTADEAGLLVWGEPWDIRNWEVTETFLKKWQWVVRGCPELMNATNAWRSRRGEKLIFRYI